MNIQNVSYRPTDLNSDADDPRIRFTMSFPSPPFPPLRSRPLKYSEGVWGSTVSSRSEVWGGAPAEIELGAFGS